MPDLLKATQKYVKDCEMLSPGQRVLVAVSGGADSMVLWRVLKALGYNPGIVHCNFQLRGEESEKDAALVQAAATEWEIPFFTRKFDTWEYASSQKVSLQVAARELRYALFEEIMEAEGYPVCATAHHADDQEETILMSLLRSNSYPIMRGIPAQRPGYCRPLLHATKAAILDFAAQNQIPFREDASNSETKYLRNKIRHDILPEFREIHPSAGARLREVLSRYEEQISLIGTLLKEKYAPYIKEAPDGWELHTRKIPADADKLEVIHLLRVLLDESGLSGNETDEVVRMIDSPSGRVFQGKTHWVITHQTGIEARANSAIRKVEGDYVIESLEKLAEQNPLRLHGRGIRFTVAPNSKSTPQAHEKGILKLDADAIQFPLTIRPWQQGDRMRPLGMRGTKKLSDIFTNEKWSLFDKMEAMVFEDAQQIICLSGFRIAESVRVTPQTTRILKIEILR